LVRLRNVQGLSLDGKLQRNMHVFKRVNTESYARKILTDAAVESLFKIGQERFDALPETCEGEPGEKRCVAGRISDESTFTMMEFNSSAKRRIQFYGAETYYRTCYPYQTEFEILGVLLKASSVLEHYMKRSVK